ncbi:U-box domain-containing protein 1-like [Magnolia sinica]|uniref:U-box domain-containing protein 1-like n=1 Tax=Magnolia sinica TaxID=86752 RepID=UPI002659C118|nr:U-box domain-containing protein 1-like [Magnolia sinica]
METAAPTMATGFLPSASLVEALIHISHEVTCMDRLPYIHARNTASTIRRIKLLSSLFEDIREAKSPLPPSSILCLTELFSTIRRTKALIQECAARSALWNLMQAELVSRQFYALAVEMGRALDILPLSLIEVTGDVREQVELLHKQARRAQLFLDPNDRRRREELFQVMAHSNSKDLGIDCKKVEEIMIGLGLRRVSDYKEEILRLEAEIQKQAGTGGLIVISNINNLISLVTYSKSMIFGEDGNGAIEEDAGKHSMAHQRKLDRSLSSYLLALSVPDEFRCPISLDLMRDPVIVATGHTYDRSSIAQWINSGHHTCPKSGQKLIHTALIPNFALKSLIHQWCHDNHVPLGDDEFPSTSSETESSGRKSSAARAVDHISAMKSAVEAIKMTADFLVGKLATGSPEIQRQAAFELRLLAKSGMDNRRIIAEAGAIPFLVTLLSTHDPRTQENAVTALLNLSILDKNKVLIMEAGAIDGIVDVLQMGKSMEARENAAAAIFSLSMVDECKVMIGAHPKAILALVGLLKEGTTTGKRDAATAIFNLAVYNANKVSVVDAGAVPLLINLLMDDKAGITDDALALLMLLSACGEGLKEIRENRVVGSILVDLMRFGSPKGKENSVAVLLGMCRNGGEEMARRLLINPRSIPSLQSLASDGSPKARRKADSLLRLLNRYCSQSHHA